MLEAVDLSSKPSTQLDCVHRPCILCNSRTNRRFYPKLLSIVKCLSCGFVYTDPSFTEEGLKKYYSQEYFKSTSSDIKGYDDYASDQGNIEDTFGRRLREISKKSKVKTGRVLDVGSAMGYFLSAAKKMGWQPTGLEISSFCCEYAQTQFGIKSYNNFLSKVDLPKNSFELVTMWDYIEHSLTPREDFNKAIDALTLGGVLALTTPDFDSLPRRIFKEKWMGFKEPEHLFYFTRHNLTAYLESRGMRILETRYEGKYVSFDFFAQRMKQYSEILGWMFAQLGKIKPIGSFKFFCNPMDIVFILAQKK